MIGSGIDGIDGLSAGDPVTAEQMRALFDLVLRSAGRARPAAAGGARTSPDVTFQEVTRLGAPFKIVDGESALPARSGKTLRGDPDGGRARLPLRMPAADPARVRTEVAREFFLAEHGREPVDARELAGQIAKDSRPRTQTVAGYDMTFSPVKSVSTLWAVADPAVAAVIERAHQAAVKDALTFIESMPCSPGPGHKGSGRSTSEAWSPPRSPIGTAGPATRICTPTSRWRTRSRPSTDAGCRSTAGCCSRPTLPRRRPTTPPSSSTSARR